MIDVNKKVRTKSGLDARILCNDRKGFCPIVGLVTYKNGQEYLHSWKLDGTSLESIFFDLVNVSEKKCFWANIYGRGNENLFVIPYKTKELADENCCTKERIACVKVEYIEGEGL